MKNRIQKISITAVCLFLGLSFTPHAFADQVNVVGNGAASDTTVQVSSNTSQNVAQTNNATITNTITTNANTGDNNASFNTGGTSTIQTGDVHTNTGVSNVANTSVIQANNCCQQPQQTNVVVAGNGAFSENKASINSSNTTNVQITQNADITNTIQTNANTGGNSESFNTGGNNTIQTGNVYAKTALNNGPINLSYIRLPSPINTTAKSIAVFGNGFGSWNAVNIDEKNQTNVSVVNVAQIINTLKQTYSTGDNSIDFNTGGQNKIITGDIIAATVVENGPVNVSAVTTDCGCMHKQKEAPVSPAVPVGGNVPTTTNVTTTSPAPATPIILAFVLGPRLPVTGTNWFTLALFGNIMMLLLGAYLRLRSGRSPGFLHTV